MRRLVLALIALACPAASLPAAEHVDYLKAVKPLLAARCFACHGSLQQKGDLRLDTVKLMLQGGKSGPVIVLGKSGDSLMLERVLGPGGARRMPPTSDGEALADKEVALLRAWIDQGADHPADEKPETDPHAHWSFRTPKRPAVPVSPHRQVGEPGASATGEKTPGADAPGSPNPIDCFLADAQHRHGVKPQPQADRRLLLRRLYLDLAGLPPTRAEQAAFEADASPDAYEKVVERLLASKQYGERWGRHWMDVWRYSDHWGLGAEVRNSQKHIWHWRDWIIESLNADKGYDQMLREMLAADELYPNDLDRLRATGYLARSYFKFNRNSWLDETIEHTGKTFLGLTFNCARCHDHKYDPISQVDYYRFRAIFEPYQVRLDQLPGEADLEKDGLPRVFDCNLDTPTYRFHRGDEKQPLKERPLTPGLPPLLTFAPLQIKPVPLPAPAHSPGLRPFVLENQLRRAERDIAAARVALAQARQKLAEIEKKAASDTGPNRQPKADTPTGERERAQVAAREKDLAAAELQPALWKARAAADSARLQQPTAANAAELAREAARLEKLAAVATAEAKLAAAEANVLAATPASKAKEDQNRAAARTALEQARKVAEKPGETYTPLRGAEKTPESNLESESSRSKPFPTTSTGRRSALAAWLTDPRHPLTARVAVNHVWMRHLGKPLVPTVFEFGRKGMPPTHPELLDWLAVELMEHNWSLKHLHRLIVTSQAYCRSSSSVGADPATVKADPDNRWYWRMNSTRMEAQVVRDSLLHLAGELDLTLGGPSLHPVNDAGSRRRSLYFVHSHNDHHKFLAMFDDASVLECYRRAESIVPQQALALANSQFALATAEKINAWLLAQPGMASDADFVRAAFETILAARPSAAEQAACEEALTQLTRLLQEQKTPDATKRARLSVVQALVNHNDFVTIR